MNYGHAPDNYVNSVKKVLSEINCESLILTEFMNDAEIAVLRAATDIFIHAQTTDALSASVLECLYAGAILINPIWIRYDELIDNEIEYVEFAEFINLPNIILKCINNVSKNTINSNRAKLRELYSWDILAKMWRKLYGLDENGAL